MNMKNIPFPRCGLAALLFLAVQSPAWAHAFLDHAEPSVGGTVTNSPSEVKIWFTQKVEPAFSSIEVDNAQGKEVDKKDVHVDAKDKSLLEISLPQLPAGTYTVTWHVVSVDTHRTQGHFQFTVK
ncbi:MAG TPA: copper homeostasis periplasmic binding protein CopC [Verrucomicrobiae bacterium]|nr:copper homeostasis periplasmic binding protein CopC [Verrucomicrobiae bacterium]